jgi:hypothetical protein
MRLYSELGVSEIGVREKILNISRKPVASGKFSAFRPEKVEYLFGVSNLIRFGWLDWIIEQSILVNSKATM